MTNGLEMCHYAEAMLLLMWSCPQKGSTTVEVVHPLANTFVNRSQPLVSSIYCCITNHYYWPLKERNMMNHEFTIIYPY